MAQKPLTKTLYNLADGSIVRTLTSTNADVFAAHKGTGQAYILGEWSGDFYKVDVSVTPHVVIERPDPVLLPDIDWGTEGSGISVNFGTGLTYLPDSNELITAQDITSAGRPAFTQVNVGSVNFSAADSLINVYGTGPRAGIQFRYDGTGVIEVAAVPGTFTFLTKDVPLFLHDGRNVLLHIQDLSFRLRSRSTVTLVLRAINSYFDMRFTNDGNDGLAFTTGGAPLFKLYQNGNVALTSATGLFQAPSAQITGRLQAKADAAYEADWLTSTGVRSANYPQNWMLGNLAYRDGLSYEELEGKPEGFQAWALGNLAYRDGLSYEELEGKPEGFQAWALGNLAYRDGLNYEELEGKPEGFQAWALGNLAYRDGLNYEELEGKPEGFQAWALGNLAYRDGLNYEELEGKPEGFQAWALGNLAYRDGLNYEELEGKPEGFQAWALGNLAYRDGLNYEELEGKPEGFQAWALGNLAYRDGLVPGDMEEALIPDTGILYDYSTGKIKTAQDITSAGRPWFTQVGLGSAFTTADPQLNFFGVGAKAGLQFRYTSGNVSRVAGTLLLNSVSLPFYRKTDTTPFKVFSATSLTFKPRSLPALTLELSVFGVDFSMTLTNPDNSGLVFASKSVGDILKVHNDGNITQSQGKLFLQAAKVSGRLEAKADAAYAADWLTSTGAQSDKFPQNWLLGNLAYRDGLSYEELEGKPEGFQAWALGNLAYRDGLSYEELEGKPEGFQAWALGNLAYQDNLTAQDLGRILIPDTGILYDALTGAIKTAQDITSAGRPLFAQLNLGSSNSFTAADSLINVYGTGPRAGIQFRYDGTGVIEVAAVPGAFTFLTKDVPLFLHTGKNVLLHIQDLSFRTRSRSTVTLVLRAINSYFDMRFTNDGNDGLAFTTGGAPLFKLYQNGNVALTSATGLFQAPSAQITGRLQAKADAAYEADWLTSTGVCSANYLQNWMLGNLAYRDSLNYDETGAAAQNHNHDTVYAKLSGGTFTGPVSLTYNGNTYTLSGLDNYLTVSSDLLVRGAIACESKVSSKFLQISQYDGFTSSTALASQSAALWLSSNQRLTYYCASPGAPFSATYLANLKDLEDYAKTTDLNSYAKTSALNAYATTASLNNYAKTSDLSAYATTASLNNYAKTSDLNAYATTASLNNYAKTSDLNAYATTAALNSYVLKEVGKALSSNDFSNDYKLKLDNLSLTSGASVISGIEPYRTPQNWMLGNLAYRDSLSYDETGAAAQNHNHDTVYAKTSDLSVYATLTALNSYATTASLGSYVLKESGKVLSSNDFSNDYKLKLDNLALSGIEPYRPSPNWALGNLAYRDSLTSTEVSGAASLSGDTFTGPVSLKSANATTPVTYTLTATDTYLGITGPIRAARGAGATLAEGGSILYEKPAITNLSSDVYTRVYNSYFQFKTIGTTAKGCYIDLSACGAMGDTATDYRLLPCLRTSFTPSTLYTAATTIAANGFIHFTVTLIGCTANSHITLNPVNYVGTVAIHAYGEANAVHINIANTSNSAISIPGGIWRVAAFIVP